MRTTNPPRPLYKGGSTDNTSPPPVPLQKERGANSHHITMIYVTLCFVLASCGGSQKPTPATEQLVAPPAPISRLTIPRDSVVVMTLSSDASQSYAIYYPGTTKSPENTPIIVCFDPHGDGRIPIDKYKKWADKYGIAIAGSNSSHNGLNAADGQQIASGMIADISGRLGFDRKNMALCGFSGGAKVAINAISGNTDISNLIYAGAVTQLTSSHPINILGFAGEQDMNYTDLLQFAESVGRSNPNNDLITFTGKHEWPDVQTFENAFYWLAFQSYRQTPSIKDSALIKAFTKKMDKAIADASAKNEWIKAYQESHTAYTFLNGLADVSSYKSKISSLEANEQYKKAMQQQNEIISKEANEKQMLMQAFQNQSGDWWGKVISSYQASTNPSDKRLLGFISLAGYSYSNQLLQQHNLDGAERMLAIYEMADPTNTDQLYFHAMLYAQRGKNALAIQYLQRAVKNGFTDLAKMDAEPSFTPLRNDPGFVQIRAALRKASK